MKSKIMSALVVLTMVLSSMVVLNTYDVSIIDTASGERLTGSPNGVILTNDGMGKHEFNLTCGEEVTWYFNSGNFTKDDEYIVKVWNGTGYRQLDVDDETVDKYGDLAITFNVPGYSELDDNYQYCPTIDSSTGSNPGTWNVSLFKDLSTDERLNWTNTDIHIGNLYMLKYYYQGDEIDHLIYNTSYSQITVEIHNWTGTKYELVDGGDAETDDTFDCAVYAPGPTLEEESGSVVSDGTWEVGFQVNEDDITIPDYEANYWVNVTVSGSSGTHYSNMSLPVLLNMTCTYPTDAVWGDTIDLSGYILEGINSDPVSKGISGYDFRVYAPNNDGEYDLVYYDDTNFEGYYSAQIKTGSGESACAGTWYVGTYDSSASERPDMTLEPPYTDYFIPYASFDVDTLDDVRVDVENTDDIIVDFDQTINVSVKNESWMKDSNYEFKNMQIHITGLEAWDGTNEYEDDDIVLVADSANITKDNDNYAYYEFSYRFNQSGTATVLVSWEGNQTSYAYQDSYYDDTYLNNGLLPNATGSATFSVVGSDDMNLIVENMVEYVQMDEVDTDEWQNGSQDVDLKIYGSSQDDGMNATIEITGCGLDITIDEEDPGDTDECISYPTSGATAGLYTVRLSPKYDGTITITLTNGTEDKSMSKDYTVYGLSGSVTTSDGDDLKIQVGTTETITADVTGGSRATVYVTFFDDEWNSLGSLNKTIGDGRTEGEGLNGIFNFNPEAEDIDELGYIVVGASAGDEWMYDIIEVEPIYDLDIELLNPTLVNATPILTVGLEQDLEFNLVGPDGNIVEDDDPVVTVKLIDDDHDEDNPLMSWSSESSSSDWLIEESGDEWQIEDMRPWWKGQLLITGQNETDGIAHEGNYTLDVDYATITYSPDSATAGIGIENMTITITGVDANGDALPEDTRVYLYCNDSVDTEVGGDASNENAVDFDDFYVDLDEDGIGEFDLAAIGDKKTTINATLRDNAPSTGNRTLGEFNIYYPNFALDPDTIYLGQSNDVEITTTDTNGDPIYGINLTFVSSLPGILTSQPDPVMTNADGIAELSISPQASGKLNVTIARDLDYEDGQLNWTNSVITDSVVTVTSIKAMKISISKSPIYQGETLTVTVTSSGSALSGVDVEFAETTAQTDSNGEATFTVPDPGVESATYTITAEKAGFNSADKSITVIKVYSVQIVGPNTPPAPGEEFTVSIIANGQALAGATVEFNGNTYTSNARGEITLTAPDSAGSYTVSASYGNYEDGTLTITVDEGEADGVPGFELLTLVAALGAAFILLRRRRRQ